ncbi:MAG: hypothetical protein NT157_01615 [Candidatus Micrarchaeota archaeon]|nr:hypothetical protein [Candidatus Micrarchaeota archaeon]
MVKEEKQRFLEAWGKHIEGTTLQHKFSSFSSVGEAVFCESFRRGILAHRSLTKKEKREICTYTKL